MVYDEHSGLIYTEQVAPAVSLGKHWIHNGRGGSSNRSDPQSSIGAASLRDTAIQCVCANVHLLTFDTLRGVPWTVSKLIWRHMSDKGVVEMCERTMLTRAADAWPASNPVEPLALRMKMQSNPFGASDHAVKLCENRDILSATT